MSRFKAEDTSPTEPLLGDEDYLTLPTESDMCEEEEEKKDEAQSMIETQAAYFQRNHPNLSREYHPDYVFG